MRWHDRLPQLPDNEKQLVEAQRALQQLSRNEHKTQPTGILAEIEESRGANND